MHVLRAAASSSSMCVFVCVCGVVCIFLLLIFKVFSLREKRNSFFSSMCIESDRESMCEIKKNVC